MEQRFLFIELLVIEYFQTACVSFLLLIFNFDLTMDKKIVGANAGKVWYALKEIDEISIPELARKLNLSVESTALAVGWLARENKICVGRKNGLIEVYDENHFAFSFG
ncbi:hypothetical protein KGMB02408_02430 [Bacteroides faecalis]|nr:hypothetical protein KGMB02408_02430 [Bacteroides faecalis]